MNNSKGKPLKKEVFNILNEAYNSGIRVLDTADSYGNAHQIIGDFHKSNNNFKFNIITKFQSNIHQNSIKSKVLEYINLMNINFLDVIMFHSYESYKSNYKLYDMLYKLKSDGLINQIGVSVYTNSQIERLMNEDLIKVIQLPFNLLDNFNHRGDLIDKLKKWKKIHTRLLFFKVYF